MISAVYGAIVLFVVLQVIRKTANFSNKKMVLPENVPFMVKLHSYHNCENALFLVLQYCRYV